MYHKSTSTFYFLFFYFRRNLILMYNLILDLLTEKLQQLIILEY